MNEAEPRPSRESLKTKKVAMLSAVPGLAGKKGRILPYAKGVGPEGEQLTKRPLIPALDHIDDV
jgi:hypothetical protein